MNIQFEYLDKKRSIIRAKHVSEGVVYRKCKWWNNKTAVKTSIVFYYFKILIKHGIVIENSNSIMDGGDSDMDYALGALNIGGYKYHNNESSKESHRELLYEFDCQNGIILGKMKFNIITGFIRSHNVKLTMIFRSSLLHRTKMNFIKKEIIEKLYKSINKKMDINLPSKNVSVKRLKYLGIYNKKINLFNRIKTKTLQFFYLTAKNIF